MDSVNQTTVDASNEVDSKVSNEHNIELANKISKGSFTDINLFDSSQLAAAENFITKVMRSEKGGIKTVNDGLAILMRAKDLNLPFSTCIEHVHVINGKTGVDVHIIKALLLKAACSWKCTKAYQALYEYTDGINVFNDGALPTYAVRCNSKAEANDKSKLDTEGEHIYVYPVLFYKDFNGNVYRNYQLDAKYKVAHNKQEASEVVKEGKIPIFRIPNIPIDYVTEYEFTRVKGNGQVMNATSSFSYNDALNAGFFEKDTYKKYPKVLIAHRAFTLGARDIASDLLMGCMETTELKIIEDVAMQPSDYETIDAEVVS